MLGKIFGRKRFESELQAELSDHLAKRVDHLMMGGMSRAEAEREAKREFGPVAKIEDEARESSGLQWIDACARNLRYAVRVLRKSPVFSATVIVTLALCIGANTAIFSVIDAMLFRPLPYPSPERLATVTLMERGEGVDYYRIAVDGSIGEYLRSKLRSLDIALHSWTRGVNLSVVGAEPRYVDQQRVSAGYFRVLGTQPMLGREIESSEDAPGGPAVAVLSEKLWRSSFGADPGIVGKTAFLRGEPYQIVGVMPAGFNSPEGADVWTPLRPSRTGEGAGTNYGAIARVRDGFTFAQADAELSAANVREIGAPVMFGPETNLRLKLISVQRAQSEATRQPALLLWAAVGLVLVIGCLNISGLLLARSATRKHEMATRIALGSGRRGLLGQMLAESLVLAVIGGLMGVGLGHLALGLLNPAAMKALGMFRPAIIDLRVLGLTAAFILLTSLLFGLVPALSAALSDLRSVLNNAGRTASARRTSWAQWGLVLGEVALAMVVLACAGFTVRTFAQFLNQNPGFDGQGVSVASISLQDARYRTARQVNRLFDESLESIRQYPGVEAAGVGLTLPYQRSLNNGARLLDGPNAMAESRIANMTYVTPGYFEALRIGLRRGRLLEDRDREGAPLVALVNEAYLRYYMKDDAQPVGRRLRIGNQVHEIVGVVAAVLQERSWGSFGPISAAPHVYLPAAQVEESLFALLHTWFSPHWVLRSETQAGIPAAMKAAVAKVDAQLPFSEFRTMDEIRAGAFARQRLSSQLLGILAGLALILASLGVYGLISGQVTARSREFGIRLALGASRWGTVARTVRGGVVLAALGVAAGWGLTQPASRFLESPGEAWRQIHADDPLTLISVAGVLIAIAAAASLVPSLRITRIDPARTLREE